MAEDPRLPSHPWPPKQTRLDGKFNVICSESQTACCQQWSLKVSRINITVQWKCPQGTGLLRLDGRGLTLEVEVFWYPITALRGQMQIHRSSLLYGAFIFDLIESNDIDRRPSHSARGGASRGTETAVPFSITQCNKNKCTWESIWLRMMACLSLIEAQ